MATTIKLKNGSGAPLATDLVQGEVALDLTNKRIYTENASGTVIEMGTSPSTIDINAGTIDGTVIGGASAAAGTFTTLNATGGGALTGTWSNLGTVTTVDINGGTIDGVTIGGASAGAGTFTTITGSGDMNIDSGTLFVDASADAVGIGTTSPDRPLYISYSNSGGVSGIKLDNTNTGTGGSFATIAYSAQNSTVTGYAGALPTAAAQFGGGGMLFGTTSAHATGFITNGTERLRILSNGDFQLYEDTGTTPKLFWDASAESLGIGTTSPSQKFHVKGATGSAFVLVEDSTATYQALLGADPTGGVEGAILGSLSNHPAIFRTNNTERMRIDSSGNLGLGVTPSAWVNGWRGFQVNRGSISWSGTGPHEAIQFSGNAFFTGLGSDSNTATYIASDFATNYRQRIGQHIWFTAPSGTAGNTITFTQAMTLDASGNLGIGTSSPAKTLDVNGEVQANIYRYPNANVGGIFDISGSNGFEFYGSANAGANKLIAYTGGTERMRIDSSGMILPGADDAQDLGSLTKRYDDVYATNALIQTSDRNEKQDIEALSEAEQRVAVAAKGLLRKFRWKSKVAEKGDDARIHFGIIAQDLQAAFEAEGLDAGRYAMFIHSTWTDEETGEERSRMGVRYSELLAFIIAAI